MRWNRSELAELEKLWAAGQSAAQIARHLECSRNAVCGRLTRLGLTRGHKPPTAKPKIRPAPKRGPTLMAAGRHCVRKTRVERSRREGSIVGQVFQSQEAGCTELEEESVLLVEPRFRLCVFGQAPRVLICVGAWKIRHTPCPTNYTSSGEAA
ncbi:hypothetical protein GWG65_36235 [Bradyrhizobium sp. CSA207]|uniref:GcrA family cell cycle regulator n=1 Tax=Bradyrhizobium sp. CSA207 TaxID=2698826 RepID=UPI0023B1A0C2|nr:GcrA family cell cycle regulator [Bradyrhizobium sp. CSA207]MDE5446714.1 hypothetical protein [Bradyrhizobium sp. CSA207]